MEAKRKRVITRNREFLACTECRRRKLKCDRQTPCNSCRRRGDETSCNYQRSANSQDREHERRVRAEARLEHLEKLVEQVAHQPNGAAFPETSSHQRFNPNTNGADAEVSMSVGFSYNGSSHWSAMLEDIQGLKSAFTSDGLAAPEDDIFETEENCEVNLLLGAATPMSLQQILSQYLPARQESDRLIAAYFRSKGACAPIVHAVQFRRLYEHFWTDPLSSPILWTSTLFSIFHVAHNTLSLGKDTLLSDDRYGVAAAQCLALGEYFRPKRWAVESLLLFIQAKCLTGLGTSPDIGLLLGVLVRLATSMGYHRDPDKLRLSAFEKEMRRRSWSLCMQLDLLISFQLGLPSNVQFPTWDTRPPRNLQDFDFDEETKELPPSRPDSEPTDIQFYIAKHSLMAVFEKILRHNLTQGMDVSSDVDKLDADIRNVYTALPDILQPRPIAASVVDPPSLIVTRLCVFFIYQKCLCVLHRPYIVRGRLQSILTCCDAASNIVQYYNDVYNEFLPGGQLQTERWFMGGISWHDYLLGVTLLCLVLCESTQGGNLPSFNLAETFRLLRHARCICREQSAKSKDSKRVQRVVDATLLRFDGCESGPAERIANASYPRTSSMLETPSAGGQANAQNFDPPTDIQHFSLDQAEADAMSTGIWTNPTEDPSWVYLEQFLNLSEDDVLASL